MSNFYQAGGALKSDFAGYIERPADRELPEALQEGEFCYVLTARQMGKSSLKVRCIQKLRNLGWKCVELDITKFGSRDATADQWYFSFLYQIALDLDFEDAFEDWWESKSRFTPVARFSSFWQEMLLTQINGEIAIFIDEIDSMLSLDKARFSTDDFFAAIRAIYNEQADHPGLRRLHFCILGVAAPDDLMEDPARTPFNVGKAISLSNLDAADIAPLEHGLDGHEVSADQLLQRILHWSGGQPYLTQRLCAALSNKEAINNISSVDEVVESIFFQPGCLNDEANLANVHRRILAPSSYQTAMLHAYGEILKHGQFPMDLRKPEYVYLKLTGLVQEEKHALRLNNHIYKTVFDENWLDASWAKLDRPITGELQNWLKSGRNSDYLLRRKVLKDARYWAAGRLDITPDERAFIEASQIQELRERDKEKRRLVLALFSMGLLLLITLITVYYIQQQRAIVDQQREKAEYLADSLDVIREALRINNLAEKTKESNSMLALQLANYAYEKFPSRMIADTRIDIYRQMKYQHRILFKGQQGSIQVVTIHPNGKLIAIGMQWGLVHIWDPIIGKEVQRLEGHNADVYAIAFHPNGKHLLTGSQDSTARLWDIQTGKAIQLFEGHSDDVDAVAIHPNGKHILTGSLDYTARLWDIQTGKTIQTFRGHSDDVYAVAIHPNGEQILTGSYDKTARLWDIQTGKAIQRFEGHREDILAVAIHPNGKHILTGSSDKTAQLWEIKTGKALQSFEGHREDVSAVAIHPNGKHILTGSYDKTAQLWDIQSGQAIQTYEGHINAVYTIAFHPNGKQILTGSQDSTARLWAIETGKAIQSFKRHGDDVYAVAIHPNGKHILTGSSDKTARLWEIETGKAIQSFEGHSAAVYALAIHPNGKHILTGSSDKTVSLWEIETGKAIQSFEGHSAAVSALAIHPNGTHILTGSWDNTARLWEIETGKAVQSFEGHSAAASALAIHPNGTHILTGSWDNTARLWEIETGKAVQSFVGHNSYVSAVAIHPNGKHILTGSWDNTAQLWDIETGKYIQSLEGHSAAVSAVAIHPNGKHILTGSWDNTTRLWDIETGKYIQSLEGHSAAVSAVAIHPNGNQILTGSMDKTARLWNAPPPDTVISYSSLKEQLILLPYEERQQYIPKGFQLPWSNKVDP